MSFVPDMRPKYGFFQKKANIVMFLASGVARQDRKARDDLIALLLYGSSHLRYYKHNISDVLVYKRYLLILDIISFPYTRRKMKFSTNIVAMLSLVGQIKSSLNCYPSLELRDITQVQCTYTHLFTG